MRYVVIEANGKIRAVESTGKLSLEALQALVGGYICSWSCRLHEIFYDAFVNDEGWILNPPLPANKIFPEIAGPIVLGHVDSEGTFLGVRASEFQELRGGEVADANWF